MTQITKWWQKISYWNKIKGTLASIGIGSEAVLYLQDSHHTWKILAAIATVVGLVIAQWFQDSNNNGKVDIFEKENPQ